MDYGDYIELFNVEKNEDVSKEQEGNVKQKKSR